MPLKNLLNKTTAFVKHHSMVIISAVLIISAVSLGYLENRTINGAAYGLGKNGSAKTAQVVHGGVCYVDPRPAMGITPVVYDLTKILDEGTHVGKGNKKQESAAVKKLQKKKKALKEAKKYLKSIVLHNSKAQKKEFWTNYSDYDQNGADDDYPAYDAIIGYVFNINDDAQNGVNSLDSASSEEIENATDGDLKKIVDKIHEIESGYNGLAYSISDRDQVENSDYAGGYYDIMKTKQINKKIDNDLKYILEISKPSYKGVDNFINNKSYVLGLQDAMKNYAKAINAYYTPSKEAKQKTKIPSGKIGEIFDPTENEYNEPSGYTSGSRSEILYRKRAEDYSRYKEYLDSLEANITNLDDKIKYI